jgi:hypothetical protein
MRSNSARWALTSNRDGKQSQHPQKNRQIIKLAVEVIDQIDQFDDGAPAQDTGDRRQ